MENSKAVFSLPGGSEWVPILILFIIPAILSYLILKSRSKKEKFVGVTLSLLLSYVGLILTFLYYLLICILKGYSSKKENQQSAEK